MSRFINPVPQYMDDASNLLDGGLLYFYESDGVTPKATYAEEAETTPNDWPLPLFASGRIPDCWFTGTSTVVLKTSTGVEVWSRDDVGSEVTVGDWNAYNPSFDYEVSEITRYSDKYWISTKTPNQGQTPADNSEYWEEFLFIFKYNSKYDFQVADICVDSSGNLWKSLQTPNEDNTPSEDDGSYWLPAFSNNFILKSADFTAINGVAYQVDASANTVNITIPTIAVNDNFIFHNNTSSSFTVLILNPTNTIKSKRGTVSGGTDIELEAGDSVQILAKSTTELEITGAQV